MAFFDQVKMRNTKLAVSLLVLILLVVNADSGMSGVQRST
jgi:hypothetical protein